MNMNAILKFFALSLACFAVIACTPSYGLFASIESETPLDINATEALKASTPSFFGTLSGKHYLAAGSLYSRTVGTHNDASWIRVNPASFATGLGSSPLCIDAVVDSAGGRIYALYKSVDGSAAEVYSSSDGVNWTDENAASPTSIAALFCIGSGTIVVARQGVVEVSGDPTTIYTLTNVGDTTAFDLGDPDYVTSLPCAFINFDTAAANDFWMIAGTSIYYGASANALNLLGIASEAARPAGPFATAKSLTVSGDPLLVLVAKSGSIYARDVADVGSGTWQSKLLTNTDGAAYSLTDIAVVTGASQTIVVSAKTTYSGTGTVTVSSPGYVELAPGASGNAIAGATSVATPVVADANNKRTSLEAKSLNLIYYDGANNILFAGVAGGGPWSTTYSGSWSGWARE